MSDKTFKCSSCKKEYGTHTYFSCGAYNDELGRLKTYQIEMYKCVCSYCNHANTDVEKQG